MDKELKKMISSDLHRYGFQNEKTMSWFDKIESYGYRYTKMLRKVKYYKDTGKKIKYYFYRVLLEHYSVKYGFSISYSTKIGYGLYLGHLGSIVVNYKASLGNNVNLAQGVTIGLANGGKNPGVPVIGNNVWIGANATVVGNITIGDDVMIAPNTFVNFDVPSHSIVINEKAKIIHKDNATEKYVENTESIRL